MMRGGRGAVLALSALAVIGTAAPASAQVDEARMRKLEAEVRAMQRKVFPGGSGQYFPQDNTAGAGQAAGAAPATSAVTDILARLDALETRLASLTAQVETNANAMALLSGRVATLEGGAGIGQPQASAPGSAPATGSAPAAVTPPKPATPTAPAAKPAGPSSERLARVQAITKPATADAAEDEYTYGFRLWEAKLYPEAQQQLQLYVQKYPTHRMISYGRNLLGRAYLDDGKPKDAAPWFVKNYDDDVQGARAADSLLYLAESMIAIKDTKRACIALAKFSETYPALATGRLKSQYDANRAKVKCN
ncbi:tetratricopeptide repeat protein [Caenibius sp. WL]|uniref:tetratricopeptide repeat protein n=1 Tax=Caenibius sp. WL TaxID=2872646 RepID=UPI001C997AEB